MESIKATGSLRYSAWSDFRSLGPGSIALIKPLNLKPRYSSFVV